MARGRRAGNHAWPGTGASEIRAQAVGRAGEPGNSVGGRRLSGFLQFRRVFAWRKRNQPAVAVSRIETDFLERPLWRKTRPAGTGRDAEANSGSWRERFL